MKTYFLILILLILSVIPAIPAIIYNDISPDITLRATAQNPGDVYMLDIDKNSTYDFFITHFEFG